MPYQFNTHKSNAIVFPNGDNLRYPDEPMGQSWGNAIKHNVSSILIEYVPNDKELKEVSIAILNPNAIFRHRLNLSLEDAIELRKALDHELPKDKK